VFTYVDNPKFTERLRAKRGHDPARDQLDVQLKEASQRLEDLVTARYVEGTVTHRVFLNARGKLERIISRTRDELASTARADQLADLPSGGRALREAWSERGLVWKRAVLGVLLEAVVVKPATKGNVWDPERVELRWKV
jgi:hypothetical protein